MLTEPVAGGMLMNRAPSRRPRSIILWREAAGSGRAAPL